MKSYFSLAAAVTGKAVTAVNRTITAGLEGNLRGGATFIADYIIHLAFTAVVAAVAVAATIRAAAGATAGLILEAFFSVEGLLRTGEEEFGAALAAGQGFVGVHAYMSLLDVCQTDAILVPWSRHQFPDEHRRNT